MQAIERCRGVAAVVIEGKVVVDITTKTVSVMATNPRAKIQI